MNYIDTCSYINVEIMIRCRTITKSPLVKDGEANSTALILKSRIHKVNKSVPKINHPYIKGG